jgi:hypothetical protein
MVAVTGTGFHVVDALSSPAPSPKSKCKFIINSGHPQFITTRE